MSVSYQRLLWNYDIELNYPPTTIKQIPIYVFRYDKLSSENANCFFFKLYIHSHVELKH